MFLLALRMTHDESLAKIVLMNDSSRLNNFRIYHSQKLRKKTENTDHQRTLLMTNTDCSGNYGRRESTDSHCWRTRNPRTAGFLFNFRMLALQYGLLTVRLSGLRCVDTCFDCSKLFLWTVLKLCLKWKKVFMTHFQSL